MLADPVEVVLSVQGQELVEMVQGLPLPFEVCVPLACVQYAMLVEQVQHPLGVVVTL